MRQPIRRYSRLLMALATLWGCASDATAQVSTSEAAVADKPTFIRLDRDEDGRPVSLDTAIIRLVGKDVTGAEVHVALVGAIHIAEPSYYEQLNDEFGNYEAVLYELVAPPGTKVPRGGGQRDAHPISMLQGGMQQMLGLASQLEEVDYQREHFVHADMTPEQMADSMRERGEDFLTMFFQMLGRSIAEQSRRQAAAQVRGEPQQSGGDLELMMTLLSGNRSGRLKHLLAEQFEDLEGSLAMMEGPDGSTLITERNKVALEVLRAQIAAGQRNLAIFYGAGHLPDMYQRLLDDFDFAHDSTEWVPAWDLSNK